MTRTLKPHGSWILLRPNKPTDKTAGGILLAQTWVQPTSDAVVVAAGSKVDSAITPGTRVAFNWINLQNLGREVEWSGERFNFLRADEVVGIVEQ